MVYADLVIGKTYKVSAEDCCLDVYFTSKLVAKDDDDWQTATFENGVKMDTFKDAYEEVTTHE